MFQPASMHAIIPPDEHGSAKIVHDTPDPFTRLRAAMHGQELSHGKYTRLIVDGTLWMTDADYEWRTNLEAVDKMKGDVLLAGLGIGFIVCPALSDPGVSSVTVIENNADVVALIVPHLNGSKLKIVE